MRAIGGEDLGEAFSVAAVLQYVFLSQADPCFGGICAYTCCLLSITYTHATQKQRSAGAGGSAHARRHPRGALSKKKMDEI